MRIVSREYTSELPSERALAKEYKTTAMTVSKALNELVTEGVIIREVGRGTRVCELALEPVRLGLEKSLVPHEAILTELQHHFPNDAFELNTEENNAPGAGNHIVPISSIFPRAHEQYFSPLPNELAERLLADPDISSDVMALHRSNGRYYGVPLYHSPGMLIVNRQLLNEIEEELPQSRYWTLSDLTRIKKKLEAHPTCPGLFERQCFPNVILKQIILELLPSEHDTERGKWSDICHKAAKTFADLIPAEERTQKDFRNGGSLLSVTCRQELQARITNDELPAGFELFPFFQGEAPVNQMFSVSLGVHRDAPNQERLFKVAVALTEAPQQRLLFERHHAIPIRKSIAFESFQSSDALPSEHLFMREANHCITNYPPTLRALVPALWTLAVDYENGTITADELQMALCGALESYFQQKAMESRFSSLVWNAPLSHVS